MAKHNIGPKNGMWKGGRSVASNGYVLVRVGTDHHLADVRGYAYEHRVIGESMLGRRLRAGELVHHQNGNKADNRQTNLKIERSIAHHLYHHRRSESGRRKPGERNPMILCECGCRARFRRFDSSNRPRRFVSGHNTGSHHGK